MKGLGVFVFSVLMSIMGYAKNHVIKVGVGTMMYPGPAASHLDLLQESLAFKAVEVCGDKKSVLGLSDIKIQIRNGLSNGDGFESNPHVAALTPAGNSLDLWYPSLKATAIVTCK